MRGYESVVSCSLFKNNRRGQDSARNSRKAGEDIQIMLVLSVEFLVFGYQLRFIVRAKGC